MPRRLHEAAKLPPRHLSCFPIENASTHTRCRPSSSSRPASDSGLPVWKHRRTQPRTTPPPAPALRGRRPASGSKVELHPGIPAMHESILPSPGARMPISVSRPPAPHVHPPRDERRRRGLDGTSRNLLIFGMPVRHRGWLGSELFRPVSPSPRPSPGGRGSSHGLSLREDDGNHPRCSLRDNEGRFPDRGGSQAMS